MCGIAGYVNKNKPSIGISLVEKMIRALSHRGPDNIDVKNIDEGVTLGHARLSIIDLYAGWQPMELENSWLTYNGEIYNYKDLAKKYLSSNELRSSSDSEVLLHLLFKKGIEIIKELDGFFAFAYYKYPYLYIVRDHFGKKPVYFSRKDDELIFASEIRALAPLCSNLTPNFNLLESIGTYNFSESLSLYEEIEIVPPGSYARFDVRNSALEINKYYDLKDSISLDRYKENYAMKEADLLDQADSILQDAVRKRLMSDVPVATICSGGLDSSLITSIANRYKKIDMLHIDVEGASEFEYASELSRHLNTNLHVAKLDKKNYGDLIKKTILHYEYPLIHQNNVGIMRLGMLAKDLGFKVILGGEAADEIYGGYQHHSAYLRIRLLNKLLLNMLPMRIASVTKYLFKPQFYFLQSNKSIRVGLEIYLNQKIKEYELLFSHTDEPDYQSLLLLDFSHYLQPLLLRSDKLFMANSVEGRLPFMDKNFVEFSINLPAKYKKNKNLLKLISRRYLPSLIIDREKAGFAIPHHYDGDRNSQEQARYLRVFDSVRQLRQFHKFHHE